MDFAPDCSVKDVKPIVSENNQGQPLVLPDDSTQIITIEKHPYLVSKIVDDIITKTEIWKKF